MIYFISAFYLLRIILYFELRVLQLLSFLLLPETKLALNSFLCTFVHYFKYQIINVCDSVICDCISKRLFNFLKEINAVPVHAITRYGGVEL